MMEFRTSVVLVVALVLTLAARESAEPCPAITPRGAEFELTCVLPGGTEIEISSRAGEYVTLECGGNGIYTCNELPKTSPTSAPPSRAMLRNCALPVNESLTCTLEALAASSVTSLILSGVPNGAAATLRPKHVYGFVNLTTLTLVGSAPGTAYSQLPTAALAALPSLRRLTVREARLQLKSDSLAGFTRLEYLELSMSKIKELNASVLRGMESLHTLNLFFNDLRVLLPGTFEGLNALETLELGSNPLQSLGEGVLAAAPHLRNLRLVGTNISKLDEPALRHLDELEELQLVDVRQQLTVGSRAMALPKLRMVQIERCRLTMLPGDALAGASSLQSLSLSYNTLKMLPPELLRDAGKLRSLNLSDNKLELLTPALFKSLWHLEELNLDNNHLEEFSDYLFESLRALRVLSARNNRLRIVSPTAFQGARALWSLDLAHNELTLRFGDGAENVTDGYTDFVTGRVSPMNSNSELRRLDLGHNLIQDIFYDWRGVLLNLELLNLTNNHVEVLTDPDINFIGENVIVDLRYNEISTIQVSELLQMARIDNDVDNVGSARLLLDGNPFHCDCHMHSLLKLLNNPSYSHTPPTLKLDAATCVTPPELANMPLRSAPLHKLTCTFSTPPCPDNCDCTVHPASNAIELDCVELPTTIPAPTTLGLNRTVMRLRRAPLTLNLSLPVNELILSDLGLTRSPKGPAPPELQLLDLTGNQLTEVPSPKGLESYQMRLARNPFACDCAHSSELVALQRSHRRVKDYENITCAGGTLLRLKDAAGLCAGTRAAWAAGAGGTLALLGLLATMMAILWLRYQNEIKVYLFARGWCGCLTRGRKELPAKYDVFLSFSHKDEDVVVHKLVPELERRGYRLCVHYRDWAPGESIAEHVSRSVHEARRTLVVASPGFLSSEWARAEFRAAHARALREGRARVIVVLLGDLPAPDVNAKDDDLRAYLRTNTYLKWGDQWFWEKLQYALPHRPLDDRKDTLPLVPQPAGTLSAATLRSALAVHLNPKDKLDDGLEPRLLPPPAL